MALKSNSKAVNEVVKAYILENFDTSNYTPDYDHVNPSNIKEVCKAILDCCNKEKFYISYPNTQSIGNATSNTELFGLVCYAQKHIKQSLKTEYRSHMQTHPALIGFICYTLFPAILCGLGLFAIHKNALSDLIKLYLLRPFSPYAARVKVCPFKPNQLQPDQLTIKGSDAKQGKLIP